MKLLQEIIYCSSIDYNTSLSMERNMSTVALQPWDDEKSKKFSSHALVGRIVSSEKNLMSKDAVKSIINRSWGFTDPLELFTFQPNIFVLFFKNKADRTRAWNLRPWSIQGYHFLLQPWKPGYTVQELGLDQTSFWVHVHGLPLNFISLPNVEAIGNLLGEFEEVDDDKFGLSGCLRLRVKWDIRKPLIPGFPLKRENLPDAWICLQYEKLNDFCSECGLLGHDMQMCETLSDVVTQPGSEVNLRKLGPWIRASSASCPGIETVDTPTEEKQPVVIEGFHTQTESEVNATLGTPTEAKQPVLGGGTPTLNGLLETHSDEKQPATPEGTPTPNVASGSPTGEKQQPAPEETSTLNATLGTPTGEKQQVSCEGTSTLNGVLGAPTEKKQQAACGGTSALNAALGGPTEEKQRAACEETPNLNATTMEKQEVAREGTSTLTNNEIVNPSPPNNQLQRYKTPSERRKLGYTTVNCLKPGTNGHKLIVKVLNSSIVLQKGSALSQRLRDTCIAECLVGDETGTILFTARNDQVDLMKPGRTIALLNAKINMFKGCMRLAIDKSGRAGFVEPADFEVDEEEYNNRSLVEYELCTVVDE